MAARRRMQPIRAWRALRALMNDPNDTAQVFHIIDALTGRSATRSFRRFRKTPVGRRVLSERRSIVRLLEDRSFLEALPDASLGRAYLDFVDSEGITAGGLVQASDAGTARPADDPDLQLYGDRMRDLHDLWHVVTGYRGDLIGEGAILAFSLTQIWNPGVALVVAMGLIRAGELGPEARGVMLGGFLRGFRARWLPEQNWEALLVEPLGEVRQRLRLGAPPRYQPVRFEDLDPQGEAARISA